MYRNTYQYSRVNKKTCLSVCLCIFLTKYLLIHYNIYHPGYYILTT